MGKVAKVTEKGKGFINDFKQFIMRGNVIDMAVAVVMGAAFNKIISSLVNDVIMPAIGALLGGINFTDLKYVITEATVENGVEIAEVAITYGVFIQTVIDFLIIAICMFIVVKLIATLSNLKKKKEEPKEEEPEPEPEKSDEVKLLEEIRDLLKK